MSQKEPPMITERTIFRDVPIPVSLTPEEKLRAIVLPKKIEFQGVSFYDAVAFLRQEAAGADDEADEQLRGVVVWVVDDAGAIHCVPALPRYSVRLDRLVASGPCSFTFERVALGDALYHVARWYGMEMQVTEAGVFLWLPGALPDNRISNPPLQTLKEQLAIVNKTLHERGLLDA